MQKTAIKIFSALLASILTTGLLCGECIFASVSENAIKEKDFVYKEVSALDGRSLAEGNIADDVTWTLNDNSDTTTHGAIGSIKENNLRMYALNHSGKMVNASKDAVLFYYTKIDSDKNFELSATIKVNDWNHTNGQNGFGIMAADRTGKLSSLWNNSFAAAVTGHSYNAAGGTAYVQIGPCAIEKYGVTKENLKEFDSDTDSAAVLKKYFNNDVSPIHEKFASKGYYNFVKNAVLPHTFDEKRCGVYDKITNPSGYEAQELSTVISDEREEFKLCVKKTNAGYFISYTDENDKEFVKKYYLPEGFNPLDKLEAGKINVGFFAARDIDMNVKDVVLKVTDSATDPLEEPELNYMTATLKNVAGNVSNSENYCAILKSNWDGRCVVTGPDNEVVYDEVLKADTNYPFDVKLKPGSNKFKCVFTPDKYYHYGYDSFHPAAIYNVLKSYSDINYNFYVTYGSYGDKGDVIYVSPEGNDMGDGTREAPYDIYTAGKFVQPGQTILLLGGVYRYGKEISLLNSVDGTKDKHITLMGDPDSSERAVFDFEKKSSGFYVNGDYWDVKSLDVTNTSNGKNAFVLTGSYITAEDIRTYRNGNTGFNVATQRYGDPSEYWPHDILIKNCLSYENADVGYEDADGFGAKITVGENIVFDGCIAHHNADDGWDLYAKKEHGCIGSVTIRNCIAYSNGYVHDNNGNIIIAGNGNGFKLGGESLKAGHRLENCCAFLNKAIGIDSNTCPDIKIYNSITFDNGGSNVALATSAANTDYVAEGIISFRLNKGVSNDEKISLKNQSETAVYNETNFFWNNGASTNSNGVSFDKSYFESLEFDPEKDEIKRHRDGSINLDGFLELSVTEIGGLNVSDIGVRKSQTTDIDESEDGHFYTMQTRLPDFTYDGMKKVLEPFEIKDEEGNLLKMGVDFKVSYKNNKDASMKYENGRFTHDSQRKQPQMKITFKGTYKKRKPVAVNFEIRPAEIGTAAIDVKKDIIKAKPGRKFAFIKKVRIYLTKDKETKLNLKKDIADIQIVDESSGELYSGDGLLNAPAGDYLIMLQGQGNFYGSVKKGHFRLERL